MKTRFIAAVAILLSIVAPASAHRLDEYLQAALISVEKDRVQVSMRLIPGVAVSSVVLASIDTDADGFISSAEQQAYAARVLADLSFTVDGIGVKPKIVSIRFPEIRQIKGGLGEIQIELTAALSAGGLKRRLVLENHHQIKISAYLVNCLVPLDPDIQIIAQNRNELQSFYQLDYVQAGSRANYHPSWWWAAVRGRIGAVGFASIFGLGVRHIAEGTDHLLFLLTLLLPAPLVASGTRWRGCTTVRQSLLRVLGVVTAFTVGHSITLALAALGLVHVPNRLIEVLIAVSILVSAVHALRPLFPEREAAIAAFFGLVHGLAFATLLAQLGLGRWERVASILAFNLGIETMQLVVVAASLPSLVLLSRTRAYSWLRVGGALFAGAAALGWIAERLFGLHLWVDPVVDKVAHHGIWIAGMLFLISLVRWWLGTDVDQKPSITPRLHPALKRV
jgi:hypothetical protein